MRYGHSEGHTEVCFDDSGKFIVTCGNDGDVRIWEGLDDDDPKFITVGEKAYSLALKNNKLVTASSNNTVQIHTFPDGDPDGILTRFTTNATHVTFNSSGSRVAAGSSDFMVKVVEVSDSSQQKTLRGHEAPVLSVTFDPKDDFLASASCDGNVVVWNIKEQSQLISWPLLQKTNDVSNAKSLCRLAWQPGTAKFLAVPVESKVQLYERGSWDHVSTLSDDLLTQLVNVVAWSPCGQFLAAGSVGGSLNVWDVSSKLCVERQKHEKGFTVCGLAWHPSGSQIAYTDTEGCLGLLDGLRTSTSNSTNTASKQAVVTKPAKDYDALFDDDDDDRVMDEGVRSRAILDDENSLDTGSLKLGQEKCGDDDDTGSGVVPAAPLVPLRPAYEGPMPTPPQKAFQPGSTPAHLTHRFMMWNSVGIVRDYNDEQDNAIDVEFHDTAVHHAMHLTNTLGHTMADLSQEAVLLACPGTDELASKLQCLHFSSWDTNKEWMVDLPQGEDVRALCLGQGWAAVATSTLMIRVFSIGGVQREIFSLPGNVVCMVAHGEQLLIVYHRGFDGEQALGVQLLQFGPRKRQLIHGEPLPLSHRSYLSWLGFTAEDGVVRMLNRSVGNTWTPVCNTRETCKSKSDSYWVVGIHENPQQLRLPVPSHSAPTCCGHPALQAASVSDLHRERTDGGKHSQHIRHYKLVLLRDIETQYLPGEQYCRSLLFSNHFSFLSSSGYEIDEEAQSQSQKDQQELLMKMFALLFILHVFFQLSCKLEREFRCVELAELMTQKVVTLAIRYASRSRRMALAQRLSVNPFAKEAVSPVKTNLTPITKGGRANPFKVLGSGKPSSASGQPRVTNILDNMTTSRKSFPLSGPAGKQNKNTVLKPLAPRPKTKTQSTLLQMSGTKASNKKTQQNTQPAADRQKQPEAPPPASPADNTENKRPKTGFQFWLEENRKSITADNPDLEETDVIKEAMGRFRTLSAEDRLVRNTGRSEGRVPIRGEGHIRDGVLENL
ncbi:hypothetical protein JOQ06_008760 [Pogonophryne albipinna]|uniref:WD repeat and HMG-box DNA-binding protein 1 n=1 Tax=Pogonophryne albipinna TaxID=1090488 RepID=A0AAD6BLT5_9TELE|nr:hypothetical protein JOQ06_008760 [Pogonophryne albipinna]